jgi:uncharacterized protein (TIGR02147 family)
VSPIIGQLDYRAWLRQVYEERKARDAFFSYRFLAEKVWMDHSLLIKVLQGERHLAEGVLDAWVRYLDMETREEEYFRTLVRFAKTRSSRERTQSLDRLLQLQGTRSHRLERDQWEYFRDWRHVALRSLLGLDGGLDPTQAGARLDPPMGPRQARDALVLLERLHLVRKEPDGRWALTDDFVEAGPEIAPTAVREHQKQMLALAIESIDRHPPEIRQVSSATFALSLSDLPEARTRIRALRDSLLHLSSESGSPDQVFQFEAVLFPLTKVDLASGRKGRRK